MFSFLFYADIFFFERINCLKQLYKKLVFPSAPWGKSLKTLLEKLTTFAPDKNPWNERIFPIYSILY